jgi:hypothetical protein
MIGFMLFENDLTALAALPAAAPAVLAVANLFGKSLKVK